MRLTNICTVSYALKTYRQKARFFQSKIYKMKLFIEAKCLRVVKIKKHIYMRFAKGAQYVLVKKTYYNKIIIKCLLLLSLKLRRLS